MPACADPLSSAPAMSLRSRSDDPSMARLGPSANGGRLVPHHSPSISSGDRPALASARTTASHDNVSDVLVGRAHRSLTLAAP